MTMSEENKHTSFFPPEDSPITVPPADEAWSLMRPMLDKGMPVTRVKGSWFRNFRWLAPAAVVTGVGLWLVVRKPLVRDTGRVVEGRVSVGRDTPRGMGQGESAGVANGDSVARFGRAEGETGGTGGLLEGDTGSSIAAAKEREGKTGAEVAGAKEKEGKAGVEPGLKAGGGRDSIKRDGGEIVKTDRRGGEQAGGNEVENADAGKTVKRSGERLGRSGSAMRRGGDATGQAGGAIGGVAGATGRAGGGSEPRRAGGTAESSGAGRGRKQEGGEVAQRPTGQSGGGDSSPGRSHHRHEGKAQLPSLAITGPGYDRSSPGSYAASRIGWRAGKSLLPVKASAAKGGTEKGGVEKGGAAKGGAAKTPAGKGEQILAVGLWDGLNFAVDDQTAYRWTSSDGPDLLPDHLPGAYVRMYVGDRVYIDAGLRLYSPQYTRLQQIDSTGGPDTTYNPFQTSIKDTVVSLEKLYYTDIPLTIHYRVAGGLYLGGGLQYSRLWDGAAIQRFDSQPSNGTGPVVSSGNWNLDLKKDPGALARLRRSDWRVLLDVAYRWKRLTLDLRYQQALTSYVRPGQGGSAPHNSALQLNLSYDIWRQRRKK